jgi:DNA-binding winged helix-turn-helix (wHTH) protein/tetratricopeptide (TPR) repeat protein
LQPSPCVLYRGDELVPLTPKALAVLLLLAEKAGEVVPKQQILDTVWAGSFVEETSLTKNISVLRKILAEEFPQTEAIRTISKVGYQLTIPVSDEEPEPPKPTRSQVVAELPQPQEARPSNARMWITTGVTLILASICVWSLRALILPQPPRSAVCVISFHDLSGKPQNAWLSRAVSEMLTTELDADSKLRTLPGDVIARLRTDLGLPDQSGFSAETLDRIRRAADCAYVVSGSYLSIDGNVRLDVRVQDTAKPESAAALTFAGTEKNLPDLAARAGAAIRARFGVKPFTPAEELKVESSLPSNPGVRPQYAEALEKLDAFDPVGAKNLLERVVAEEPDFAGGHRALSTAWQQMGYELAARDQAKRAFELSVGLPRQERLAIEARYRETASQWDRAVEIYNSLWTFYPDNLDYGFALAHAQSQAGKHAAAEKTLAKLRDGASPAILARVDLESGDAAVVADSYAKAASAYTASVEETRRVGARLLEGRAQSGLALALEKSGDAAKSRAAWQEAVRICTELGDSGCVASTLNNEAVLFMDTGDLAQASQTLAKVLDLAHKAGNRGQEGRALNIQGMVQSRQGDLKASQASALESLAVSREISDLRLSGTALHHLGDLAVRTGDESAALRYYTDETQVARQTDNKVQLGNALDGMGRLENRRGDLAGARRDLEEALRLKRQGGSASVISSSLAYLANVLKNQGDLAGARKLREEECGLAESAGRKATVQRCRVSLAELDLLMGRTSAAMATAQPIATAAKSANPGADAWRVLALARLASGDAAGAHDAIARAQDFATASGDSLYIAPVAIAAARVESALGHKREASQLFAQAMVKAKQADTFSLVLEARLAIAEAAVRDGDKSARKQLNDLIADSRKQGYSLFAARGQKLLASLGPEH